MIRFILKNNSGRRTEDDMSKREEIRRPTRKAALP